MTLEQLRIFVAVAEREHVTRAAQALNLTQSAVSGALAALEAQHGVRLFDRVGRGVALNETGRAFLVEARGVLSRAAAAEAALDDLGGLRRGRVTIQAAPTIAAYWLPARLAAFRRAYPGLVLEVAVGDTQAVARAVLEGEAELGFVGAVPPDPRLSARPVGLDQMAVLVGSGHPWAARKLLSAADLKAARWVLREPGSGTRASLEAALASAGVRPEEIEVDMTLPSNEAVLAVAEAMGLPTALSENVAAAALASGRLVRAAFPLPARSYHLLRHKERHRSRAGDAFVDSVLADATRLRPSR